MPEQTNDTRTAEEKLAEAQQKLAEAEQKLAETQQELQQKEEEKKEKEKDPHRRPIEGIYDKINVPVKYVDYFIIAVVIAFGLVVVIGMLKGKGIL